MAVDSRDILAGIRKARRDLHGLCRVLGCPTTARPGSIYCSRHNRRRGSYDEHGVPRDFSERAYMAHKHCRFLKKALDAGEITETQLKNELLHVVMRLMQEEPASSQPLREAHAGRVLATLDSKPFRKLKSELTRHYWMYRQQPMLGILIKTPYEFQVAEMREEDGYLKILLMTRVDHEFEGTVGYLSSRGGFLPKAALIPVFDDAYATGRLVLVSAQRSTLHRMPGRKYPPEVKAKLQEERKHRRMKIVSNRKKTP